MSPKGSLYIKEWLSIAEKDLERVTRILNEKDPELAGFCLQQSIEKFLKAFLLYKGWELRKIHNLDALLDDAVIYDSSLEEFRGVCQKVTAFYFIERYPLIADMEITDDDVRTSLQTAKKLADIIKSKINL